MLLGVAAAVVGVFWGLWSTTSWLPDNLGEIEPGMVKTVADPTAFAVYAAWVGAVFVIGHWVLGRVWKPQFNPGRVGTAVLAVVMVGLHVIVMLTVPWAPIKLGAMLGLVAWSLIRSRRQSEGPTIFEQLDGRVRWREAAILLLMPVAPSVTYAGAWAADLSDGAIETIYVASVFLQVAAGAGIFIWAVIRSFRSKLSTPLDPEKHTSLRPS